MKNKKKWRIATRCIHGYGREKGEKNRSISVPIDQTAAYGWDNTNQIRDFYKGLTDDIKYGRYGNRTQQFLEGVMAAIEEADKALVFSSGMAAITTAVESLLKTGDHLVYVDECYRNSRKFFQNIYSKFGIEATPIAPSEINKLEDYLKSNSKLFFAEVPTNPFLRVIDLEKIVSVCRRRGLISFIDASFASPINLRPLEYGADLVIHSATKYLGGHDDLLAGVIVGRLDYLVIIEKEGRNILGPTLGAFDSSLLIRSLETLDMRMERLNKNGRKIARFLEKCDLVEKIWYPGFESHPDFNLAKKQMSGFGSVVTFTLRTSEEATSRFVDSLILVANASNFGGTHSIIEQPRILTFSNDLKTADERNITGNLLRLSVGGEDYRDIIYDLRQAFEKL